MKKFIIPLLASVIMLASCTKDKNDIVVFFTNDVHCGIENNICYAGVVEYRNEALKPCMNTPQSQLQIIYLVLI